jgi:MraZ protein
MGASVKVDQKGRLKIPATLLTKLQVSGTQFYVTSESGDSVRIYPMRIWTQVEEHLERLCSRNSKKLKLLARAKYFGRAVNIDKQGRLLIPITLRSSAQMMGTVDIIDYLNYLEVWNHGRFLKSLRSTPIATQDEKTMNKLSYAVRFPRASRKEKRHAYEKVERLGTRRRPHRHSREATRDPRTDSAPHARVA